LRGKPADVESGIEQQVAARLDDAAHFLKSLFGVGDVL